MSISLDVREISKSFKKQTVLDKVSFSARGGDLIALVGENGCGKSTLLNILCGISKADGGTFDIEAGGRPVFEAVAYVPQSNCLIESLSARDNLLFWYQGDSERLKKDAENGFIRELGVDAYISKKISKMSGGMQKRVAIACALANRPEILLLDEVNASLDIVCKLQIQAFLKSYAESGNIVIMATHEEGDMDICSRVLYLNEHKITETERRPLREIFGNKL